MNNKLIKLSCVMPVLLFANSTVYGADCNVGDNDLGGVVFRDFNENAMQDALEPGYGVAGMIVEAYDSDNTVVETANVDPDGTYAFPGLAGTNYRLEFKGLPDYIQYGVAGGQSDSGVKFANAADCGIDFGINNPSDYCQNNPDLATNCYVPGIQGDNRGDVLVSFPYNAGVPGNVNIDSPFHGTLALANEIGTTYGLAYSSSQQALYAAAFLKRFAGFGPEGTGGIYKVELDGTITGMSLDDYFGADSAGANPHPDGSTDWQTDDDGSQNIGKVAFGDLEISDDESTLYVINLADKQLYEIPTETFPPVNGSINQISMPNPCGNETDFRPSALKYQDGLLYIGVTCTAESTVSNGTPFGDPTQLSAHVYQFNPADNSFANVFDFALNYPRKCVDVATLANCADFAPGEWNPWIPGVWPLAFPPDSQADWPSYPQPWFADIEIDWNGDLILSFRDRFGDQTGYAKTSNPNDTNNTNIFGVMGGDILRACSNGIGGWNLESNGSCGGVTTVPGYSDPDGAGPGTPGQEYYWDEYFARDDKGPEPWHSELTIGGLTQIPGKSDIAMTAFDVQLPPTQSILDGGIIWLDNISGARSHTYRVFGEDADSGDQPGNNDFGKANGLGDLEALCDAAPIEIGNRVWDDTDMDGIQDPGESGIEGVTVTLACGDDSGSVITDANGEYLFTNTADGLEFIQPGLVCTLSIQDDDPALVDFSLTLTNADGITNNDAQMDVRDSDASATGSTSEISNFFIGDAGHNNHSFDFGFGEQEPPLQNQVLPAKPVPTLNEWMLLLLSGLLAITAVSFTRRKGDL